MSNALPRKADVAPRSPQGQAGIDQMMVLANQAREAMRLDEAGAAYQQIMRLNPGHVEAAIGLMRCHFYAQNWTEAWKAFDLRFVRMERPPSVASRDAQGNRVEKPRWTGGPAPKSLLVLDEQGMGDTIQFLRFLPRLVAGGTKVTLVTHRRLFALIRTMGLDIELRPMDESGSVAGIAAWTPMLSLPMAMGIGEADIAMKAPYLKADPARVARWRNVLGKGAFTIGVSWRGNPKAPVDAGRSASLAAFAPLAAIPGVRLISLQQDASAEELRTAPFHARIAAPGPGFDEGPDAFLDTAALMMSLDLVVSVDTAIGHLAGALGRPAALALQAIDADWRWIPGQSRTPWYPATRLYRQPARGDWFGAFARLAEDIRDVRGLESARATPSAPVSIGELVDKITILEIKSDRLPPGPKRDNVGMELKALLEARRGLRLKDQRIADLSQALRRVNEELWIIEDDIRQCEADKDFGDKFISLARAVYVTNDRRAALKSEINTLTGSALREEKSYVSFA